ncbi:hypothetical protein EYF80_052476 [Liparis tanakae]|uniref:Uncharacterized protein n=1 Tax=Liparis tanakae TaxID=230148 RepID=A0A4Z2F957_9TELE|nr:hypothetical protein EYF80_052476 [Liparis tanakae]
MMMKMMMKGFITVLAVKDTQTLLDITLTNRVTNRELASRDLAGTRRGQIERRDEVGLNKESGTKKYSWRKNTSEGLFAVARELETGTAREGTTFHATAPRRPRSDR